MITDREWNIISRTAFPQKAAKAPPFIWTRILALIESEETRRSQTWWMQWRWMVRLTATVGILVSLGAFYLLRNEAIPLDAALDGRSNQEMALHVAQFGTQSVGDSVTNILGLDS